MTVDGRRFTIPGASEARVPPFLLVRIVARDGAACAYCGASGPGVVLHVDHVRPLAHFPAAAPAGIVNAPWNLAAACEACNGAKGPQNLRGFGAMLQGRGVAPGVVRAMMARVRRALRRAY